ncbi:hypothetical protein GOODEAATRI_006501 [Goodea atripinnis]|uniref:Uncharacterized protein n=1 Tax=Goodea atripinnis TaxID=208336 RepID=A0ABV0PBX1_9TELE
MGSERTRVRVLTVEISFVILSFPLFPPLHHLSPLNPAAALSLSFHPTRLLLQARCPSTARPLKQTVVAEGPTYRTTCPCLLGRWCPAVSLQLPLSPSHYPTILWYPASRVRTCPPQHP